MSFGCFFKLFPVDRAGGKVEKDTWRARKKSLGGVWESKQEVEGQEAGSHGWVQQVKVVGGGVNKKERKCLL